MSKNFCEQMSNIQNNPTEAMIKGRLSRQEKMKDYKQSDETKEKISESCKKYTKTEEHRKNLSVSLTGNKLSDETKEKISKYMTGRKRGKYNLKDKPRKTIETVTCPHCKKEGKLTGMKRWHMDNCKYK